MKKMAKSKQAAQPTAARSQEYANDSSSSSDSEPQLKVSAKQSTSRSGSGSVSDSGSKEQSSDTSDAEDSTASLSSGRSTRQKRTYESSISTKSSQSKKFKGNVTDTSTSPKSSYKPPAGYTATKSDASDFVSEAASMFSNSKGTQIWYITAPASVPVASIESLDIQAALRGESILVHQNISYNMSASNSKGEALLLPKKSKNTYGSAGAEISQTFHLRELSKGDSSAKTALSTPITDTTEVRKDLSVSNAHFFASQQGEKRSPRKQPPGLLMRYQPYGSTASSRQPYKLPKPELDDGDEENDTQVKNALQVPHLDDEDPRSVKKATRNTADDKPSKTKKRSHENTVTKIDAMDLDTDYNNRQPDASHMSNQATSNGLGPEKKKRRERKGHA